MHFDSLPRMDIPADAGRIGRALEAARAAGKEPPRSADAAFIGFCKAKSKQAPLR